ncbi:glycosyltransferase [Cryobacterium sp. CG_9.6]|uniref:glycosyltransferase family 2 protein n=1 Tax=Cryobacterium sp. CG_9.6 TaxID=2760710 RepID=UPI0024757F4D|nr:glycosyltransferase [Cryobacterium sp. CG_9.6]MDH6235967.1 GT2 family glycosyltransferase [Cryobacterium sp. CG_9.6]
MQPRVTAILVARNGAKHLERTLEALARQTRQPDIVITVDCGSTDATAKLLGDSGPTQFIAASADLSFWAALAAAVRVIAAPEHDREMLWLLAQDSAPEPGALAALLAQLEISPSVAVAGPKIMEWVAGEYIHEFGLTMTPGGSTVTLVESELDQGQHDGLSDVLAVSAGGMLVRHTVWNELDGFDPALPVIDDSLDFCVRVRLAGYRVSVVAAARAASAGAGVAGANESSRGRPRRRRVRAERSAQLHRRLVYSAGWALLFHWLSLVPLAFLRSIGQLLKKEPGAVLGEFAAAFGAAFHLGRVARARRRLASTKKLGWTSIASLRVTSAEMRRRRALQREASLAGIRGDRPEIRFFASGGAWTLLASGLLSAIIFAPLLNARSLTGGGMLPLSDNVTELWSSATYGWRDVGLGFVGAADPFSAVLAVLGSLTAWAPSFSLVLLYLLALPLAALGAWMAATRFTERGALRAIAAVLWVLAPTFLSALSTGRPAAILVHLLLPWLFFAGFSAARSWSASASAALLFAAIVACSPSLAPALLVLWLIAVATSGRSVMRFIGIPLPALALFAPLIVEQGLRGNWLGLFADPGLPLSTAPVSGLQLALGFPSGGLGGWIALLDDQGIPGVTADILVPVLLIPLALLALTALLLNGARSGAVALLLAVLGLGTALAANHLFVASVGSDTISVWSGAGLSLYWMGLVGAAVIALRALRRVAFAPGITAVIALTIVAVPLLAAYPLQTSLVNKGLDRTQPAFIDAEAQINPRVGTLQITPQVDGGIRAVVMRGSGAVLNQQSTLESTDQVPTQEQRELATLAGNLASRSGLDAAQGLADFGIRFVVLQAAGGSPEAEATAIRTATALDGNAALAPVGDTSFGRLWQHDVSAAERASAEIPPNAGGLYGLLATLAAVVVIGITVLLSIPTGAGREAVRQANRDAVRRAARENARLAKAKPRRRRSKTVADAAVPAAVTPGVPGTPLEPAVSLVSRRELSAASKADASAAKTAAKTDASASKAATKTEATAAKAASKDEATASKAASKTEATAAKAATKTDSSSAKAATKSDASAAKAASKDEALAAKAATKTEATAAKAATKSDASAAKAASKDEATAAKAATSASKKDAAAALKSAAVSARASRTAAKVAAKGDSAVSTATAAAAALAVSAAAQLANTNAKTATGADTSAGSDHDRPSPDQGDTNVTAPREASDQAAADTRNEPAGPSTDSDADAHTPVDPASDNTDTAFARTRPVEPASPIVQPSAEPARKPAPSNTDRWAPPAREATPNTPLPTLPEWRLTDPTPAGQASADPALADRGPADSRSVDRTSAPATPAEPKSAESKRPEPMPAEQTTAEPTTAGQRPAGQRTAEPTSVEPKSVNPTPADLRRAESPPAQPTRGEPAPAEPTPAEPRNAEPTSAGVRSAEPTPAETTPAAPKSAEPTPAAPTPAERTRQPEAAQPYISPWAPPARDASTPGEASLPPAGPRRSTFESPSDRAARVRPRAPIPRPLPPTVPDETPTTPEEADNAQ